MSAQDLPKNVSTRTMKPTGGNAIQDQEMARYLTDLVLDLRNLAKAAGLMQAQIYLELAYYEAFAVAYRVAVPAEEVDHIKHLGDDARRAEARLAKLA